MAQGTKPTTCQAHLVIHGAKPCSKLSVAGEPLAHKPFLLCDYHMWIIARNSKRKPPKQETVYKVKRRTIVTTNEAELRIDIAERDAEIARLKNAIAALTETPKPRATTTIDGTVYYLRIGGYIKIGWTSDMTRRMKAYPPDTVLLATRSGTRSDEATEHKRFAHLRTHGREWYPLAPQLTQHIDTIVKTHGEPESVTFMAKPVEIPRPHSGQGGPRPKGWTGRTA